MRRFPFSDPDALWSGTLGPDDAPPELKEVAGLIRAARAPASASELAGEAHLVSEIAAAVRGSARVGVVFENRRRRLIGQVLSGKVIAATVAVLLSGGAAAAATGSLPASLQRAVSHGLAQVGISVPDPVGHRSPVRSGNSVQSNGHGRANSATGADRYGLCTAYLHPSKTTSATSTGAKPGATAFSRLAAAALAKGETIAQYCQGATPPSTTVGTNRSSTHRPTTSTTPVTTGRSTGTPAGKTPASAHHPKTIPTKPTVMYVLRGTLSNYTAASTSTNGSVSITVKSSNFEQKTLKSLTLTFVVNSKATVMLHKDKAIANGDRGIVKVRAPKKADAAALQTKTAVEVIDQGSSS